jgi:hypothetical protein
MIDLLRFHFAKRVASMSDPLIRALKEAIDPTGPAYKSAIERHKGKPQAQFNMFLENEQVQHIATEVGNEPVLKNSKNLMVRIGDEGAARSFSGIATRFLLIWAKQIGPTKATRRLRTLLAKKKAPGFHVEVFAGMEVKSRTRLAHRIELLPFDQLPDSIQKNRLIDHRFNYMEFGFMHAPSAALIMRTSVSPLYCEAGSMPQLNSMGLRRDIFDATRLCLSLNGPQALVRLNSWYQYDDELLNLVSGAGGMSYPFAPYQANFNIPKPRDFDPKRAQRVTKSYFRLSKSVQEIAKRAMDRLDKAMCDRLPGDAAIDLSIALEVLTTEPGAQGEHTWKVGLRSALLLGGNLEEQQNARRRVKEIYDYRSKVVHEGHIVAKKLGAATLAVKEGTLLCARIIERVVERGQLPKDWSKFELSRGKAY